MHLQGCQDPVYFNTAGKFLDGFRAAIVFQHGPDEHVAEIVHGNKGKTTVFCNMLQSRIQGHQCFMEPRLLIQNACGSFLSGCSRK